MQRLQEVVAYGGEKARLDAVGAVRGIAGDHQLIVGLLQPVERILQFLGADAHLRLEADGRLEQRESVGLLLHRALDALHQGGVDLGELDDAALVFGPAEGGAELARFRQVLQRHETDSGRPNAIPVSVWFKCMALYCSP